MPSSPSKIRHVLDEVKNEMGGGGGLGGGGAFRANKAGLPDNLELQNSHNVLKDFFLNR